MAAARSQQETPATAARDGSPPNRLAFVREDAPRCQPPPAHTRYCAGAGRPDAGRRYNASSCLPASSPCRLPHAACCRACCCVCRWHWRWWPRPGGSRPWPVIPAPPTCRQWRSAASATHPATRLRTWRPHIANCAAAGSGRRSCRQPASPTSRLPGSVIRPLRPSPLRTRLAGRRAIRERGRRPSPDLPIRSNIKISPENRRRSQRPHHSGYTSRRQQD